MKKRESITEKLKSENPLCWIGKMNDIRNRAEELINRKLNFTKKQYRQEFFLPVLLYIYNKEQKRNRLAQKIKFVKTNSQKILAKLRKKWHNF